MKISRPHPLAAIVCILMLLPLSCALCQSTSRQFLPMESKQELFAALDLSLPCLSAVSAALASGNSEAACKALADTYRQRRHPRWNPAIRRDTALNDSNPKIAKALGDNVLAHKLKSVGIEHQFGAEIDWKANPTPNQYAEWTWQLNRHSCWDWLFRAYNATNDDRYACEFASQMCSWVRRYPPPTDLDNSPTSCWRTIEAGIRTMGYWPNCFFGFLKSPEFTDEAIATMLYGFLEHGRFLRRFHRTGNWLCMEMSGLYATGALFPEFKEAQDWCDFALETLHKELNIQVYPDGAQTELSPGYHGVSLNCFASSLDLAMYNKLPVPADYKASIEKMYEYYVKIPMPNLCAPALNDSDYGRLWKAIDRGLSYFPERKDFLFVQSQRKKGVPPSWKSLWMPYSGWAIQRSGWGPDDLFLHFDVGPMSTGHQHEDKLSFAIFGYVKQLLCEGGMYEYDSSQWRVYVLSAAAHNVTMFDGLPQLRRGRRELYKNDAPQTNHMVTEGDRQFAEGWYEDGFGESQNCPLRHYRAILFIQKRFWLLFDIFTPKDGGSHTYTSLFHLDSDQSSTLPELQAVMGADPAVANLAIFPARPQGLQLDVVKGQEKPAVQGWTRGSKVYTMRPVPTAIYTRQATGTWLEPYLLYPMKPGESCPVCAVEMKDNAILVFFKDGTQMRCPFAIENNCIR